MITPRKTRLLRVPDLTGMQQALIDLSGRLTPSLAADTFILVPTRGAARQLRRSLGRESGVGSRESKTGSRGPGVESREAHIGTRADLYTLLASRVHGLPRMLGAFEREVLAGALAREIEAAGIRPPFHLRPVLTAEMLALYDEIRRQGRSVADFERNIGGELELAADTDRGAAQLLQQTRFLAALYRRYEERLASLGAHDEHLLRDAFVATTAPAPLRHVTVTVADRTADPEGLWPVDFMLLSRLPGLEELDVIATEGMLAAGWLERLHAVLPGIAEVAIQAGPRAPVLVVPREAGPAGPLVHYSRDREEELAQVARRITADRHADRASSEPGAPTARTLRGAVDIDLDRTALVVRRPLPYLYLAHEVFGGAGIPFTALDALPLAAEPYAAAPDLALDVVISGFSRTALVALLRSPHFTFGVDRAAVSAFDRALATGRYSGGLDRLETLVAQWTSIQTPATRDERRQIDARPAATVAVQLSRGLAPLAEPAPVATQIDRLIAFLNTYHAMSESRFPDPGSRIAVLQVLERIAAAYRARDAEVEATATEVSTAIRRWLGEETVPPSADSGGAGSTPGVTILDPHAARFGAFDEVQLVGLIEGEWPERPRRSIFYPTSLLALLEPAPAAAIDVARRERDGLRAARAAFRDLMMLARQRVRVSTFALEADAVVEPSTFVDEVAAMPLVSEPEADTTGARVFLHEMVAESLAESLAKSLDCASPVLDGLPSMTKAWARLRLDRARGVSRGDGSRFLGEAGAWTLPRVSVSRVDRYLDCPFRFYASEVLKLEEEPEDEDQRTPLERGRFLHEIFETFFREWQDSGRGRITPADVPAARSRLVDVCQRMLAGLPPTDAALERARLLGSAAGAGIVDRVLTLEATRDADVRERLIEYPLEGAFRFRTAAGEERTIVLNAVIDRVDLLGEGFRLIDYKSKYTPDVRRKVQLPIYVSAVRQRLGVRFGRDVPPREALYLSFEGDRAVVPLKGRDRGAALDELVADAEDRFLAALDHIAAGHFPPRPIPRSLCNTCPYVMVCRKPIVEETPDTFDAAAGPAADE